MFIREVKDYFESTGNQIIRNKEEAEIYQIINKKFQGVVMTKTGVSEELNSIFHFAKSLSIIVFERLF